MAKPVYPGSIGPSNPLSSLEKMSDIAITLIDAGFSRVAPARSGDALVAATQFCRDLNLLMPATRLSGKISA